MVHVPRSARAVVVALVVLLAGCSVLGPIGPGGDATPSATATGGGNAETATPDRTPTPTPEAADGTPTPTPTPEPTPTPDPETGLLVVEVHAEGETLNDEYVVFKNAGELPLDVSGWRVQDEDGHTYTFPDGVRLGIGESLALHSGQGTQTESRRYWWADGEVWDDDGDTVYVYDERGQTVYEYSYS